ncbi:MAG: glycosyltransferase family 2 protein [Ignavibacteriae bacterium]|jgi:glycosyltransferase involved in cell wall biosynthesis|nr:glycosyltransferase family 2 protein [Ignavibacteriota bacterium]
MYKKRNYKFTVCTPCYNSSEYIERVFKSLKNQTYNNFEWYVINDASTDDTHYLISDFIKDVDFPVVYHNLKRNQGVRNNINLAIKEATGDFIIFYGHDDEIIPEALSIFNEVLLKYDSHEISAIYALAKDQNNKLVGNKYSKDILISDYWTQMFALNNSGEKFQCYKTKYLREFYPLNTSKDNGLPSAWLWGMLGTKYKAIFLNEILRIYYMDVVTSISNTTKRDQNPNIIFNYYKYWVNKFQYYIKGNIKRRLRGVGGYVSYGLLANKDFFEIIRPINRLENKLLIGLFYPISKIYNVLKK